MTGLKIVPGLAFTIVCDRGFAIGLYTHKHQRMGALVWMAEDFWDKEPTANDVEQVFEWRWCVYFPLAGAVRRKLVYPIANVTIPEALIPFPVMRSRLGPGSWVVARNGESGPPPFEKTADRALSISSLVNDTRLKEMLVSDWRPSQRW